MPGSCVDDGGSTLTVDENMAAACQKAHAHLACNFCPNVAALKCESKTDESASVPPPVGGGDDNGPPPKGGAGGQPPKTASGPQDKDAGPQGPSSQDCQMAAQQAGSVCNSSNGGSGGSSGSGGLNSMANTLHGATGNTARSNIQLGVACSAKINECISACQSRDPSLANQCSSLGQRVRQAATQAQSLADNQQQAANSAGQSSASNNPGAENCNINPNTPECRALAESKKYEKGEAGFNGQDQLPENFNVGSTTDGGPTQAFQGSGVGLDQIRNNATYGTIANNSGGSIPGSGGSAGAQAGGRGGRGGSPGAPGYTTDVLQGFQGASGAGGPNVGSANVDSSGGFKGYGNTARGPASQNFDLKKYLPGGSKPPNTRNLGGFIPFSLEINGPHVNIWNRISDRFMEKCKLGELIDCR